MSEKRSVPESFGPSSELVVKRTKQDVNPGSAVVKSSQNGGALIKSMPRTSALPAPIMKLTGHNGEIFAVRFDPTGQRIASGSVDRSILLWNTFGTCDNYGKLTGHKGAVMDLQWSRDSEILFSASADKSVASWDVGTGTKIRGHTGHEEIVNAIALSHRGEQVLVSGSDDGSVGVWDPRQKQAVDFLETQLPITAVAISDTATEMYSGGIDNIIRVWDLRKNSVVYTLTGHNDTITSLEISPDSQTLLSNSHDNTIRTWDIRPFASVNRHIKYFDGAPMGLDVNLIRASWSYTGDKIAAGSGDGTAVVWDSQSAKILYKLPGHTGSVNDVRLSPNDEPLIVSCSTDRNILLGELKK